VRPTLKVVLLSGRSHEIATVPMLLSVAVAWVHAKVVGDALMSTVLAGQVMMGRTSSRTVMVKKHGDSRDAVSVTVQDTDVTPIGKESPEV
jgi:hypothetical protein